MFYDSFIYSQNNSIYFGFHFMGRFATLLLQLSRRKEKQENREHNYFSATLHFTPAAVVGEQQNIWRDGLLKDYIRLDNITTQSQGSERVGAEGKYFSEQTCVHSVMTTQQPR